MSYNSPVCCEAFPQQPKTQPSTPKFKPSDATPYSRPQTPVKKPEQQQQQQQQSKKQTTGKACPYSPQKGKDVCPRFESSIDFIEHVVFHCPHSTSLHNMMMQQKTTTENLHDLVVEFKSTPPLELSCFHNSSSASDASSVLNGAETTIGVSLGNRWFTPVNLMRLLVQALSFNSSSRVTVLMVDSLHSLNATGGSSPAYFVRKSHTQAVALACAVRDMMIAVFDEETCNRVRIIGWNDLMRENKALNLERRAALFSAFESNEAFRTVVENLADEHMRHRAGMQREKSIQYLLEEAATISVSKESDIFVYPHTSSSTTICKFAAETQKILCPDGEVKPLWWTIFKYI